MDPHDPYKNDHFEKEDYPKGPKGPWYERLLSWILDGVLWLFSRK